MTAERLSQMKCVACRGGEPQATEAEINAWKPQIADWEIIRVNGVNRLRRTYKLIDFMDAVRFANRVAELAEAEDHHPVIEIAWGRATVIWWTHKIGGLHRNDFIMAAKTDEAYAAARDVEA